MNALGGGWSSWFPNGYGKPTGVRTASLCFASRGFWLHAATRIAGPDPRGLSPRARDRIVPAKPIADPSAMDGDAQAVFGDGVAMGAAKALDEAAQAAGVAGHASGR